MLKTKKELRKMFFDNFLGTIADNLVEANWALVMAWYPNVAYAQKSLTMFAVSDTLWVVLSCAYYAVRTALVANLPAYMVGKNAEKASKPLKNAFYLVYLILTPAALISFIFAGEILGSLGVSKELLSMYVPYWRICVATIFLVCPSQMLITSYLKATFRTREAMILDHATTWFMAIGSFIALWVFNWGANGIYFLIAKPCPNFFKNGFEFDQKWIKKLWLNTKWEIIRRLAPRIVAIFTTSSLLYLSPSFVSARYWIYTIGAFLEGVVDASASLANVDVSYNSKLGFKTQKEVYQNNKFIWRLALKLFFILTVSIGFSAPIWVNIISNDSAVKNAILNPMILILFAIEVCSKIRYYILLSITRSFLKKYNGTMQVIYAAATSILTPIGILIFLKTLNLGLTGVFLTTAIVGFLQFFLSEIYLRKQKIKVGF